MIHAHRNGQAEWAMMDGWTPGGCRGSLHPSILLSLILVIASMDDDDCFDFKAGDMGPSMGQAAAPCMASSCCWMTCFAAASVQFTPSMVRLVFSPLQHIVNVITWIDSSACLFFPFPSLFLWLTLSSSLHDLIDLLFSVLSHHHPRKENKMTQLFCVLLLLDHRMKLRGLPTLLSSVVHSKVIGTISFSQSHHFHHPSILTITIIIRREVESSAAGKPAKASVAGGFPRRPHTSLTLLACTVRSIVVAQFDPWQWSISTTEALSQAIDWPQSCSIWRRSLPPICQCCKCSKDTHFVLFVYTTAAFSDVGYRHQPVGLLLLTIISENFDASRRNKMTKIHFNFICLSKWKR